jgi:hypothetical protein
MQEKNGHCVSHKRKKREDAKKKKKKTRPFGLAREGEEEVEKRVEGSDSVSLTSKR